MRKTAYTCDFCIQNKSEKDLTHIEEYDICNGCMRWIIHRIIKNPLLFEPHIILTPFCKNVTGPEKLLKLILTE